MHSVAAARLVACGSPAATLERLAGNDPGQRARAQRITAAVTSYLRDYSIPLVATARREPNAARSVAATEEGSGPHRRHPGRVRPVPGGRAWPGGGPRAPHGRGRGPGHPAAAIGLGGSIVLIVVFAGYLTQAIVQPVRRAAAMADRLAGGDLGVRMAERGVGEIGCWSAASTPSPMA